jgi:hypothetical protein
MKINRVDEKHPREREGDDLIRQFLALLDDSETEEERIEKVWELIRGVTLGVRRSIESPGEA